MKHHGLRASASVLFGNAAQDLCVDLCDEVVELTAARAPKLTGAMAAGYATEEYEDGARIVNPVDYWIDVEFGHDVVDDNGRVVGHAEPRPHVRPSWEEIRARGTK